ncbi:MAG: 30S ribosomal protein S15 [Deltaproteobacteria bacterium]|nr:30S ribosomal protein S15 [Deltaproteobacteria bacterium]
MINGTKKQELIKKFKQHDKDTGSPEVQVAIMTERINEMTEHFKTHAKDFHSRRGLMKLVSNRRSLLDYLRGVDANRYKKLINELQIRK